jgi:hypothetical protein
MKDKVSAQNLLEEIETAKLYHPTPRQSASFVSRADVLLKRLALRGNPASSSSSFPCPEHSLFPDQDPLNEALAESLSSEILSTSELATKVDYLAKEYRTAYDAVKRVETLCTEAEGLSRTFTSILERLHLGVSAGDGDGSPPNLMSEECLDQSHHSAFLALLPSVLEESEEACERAKSILRSSQLAVFALDFPSIDSIFKADAVSKFQRLTTLRDRAQSAYSDVKSRVSRLREARRAWVAMCGILNELEVVRRQVGEDMEQQRWRRHTDHGEKPLTPDSPPTSPLPINAPHKEFSHVLGDLSAKLTSEVNAPLNELSKTLELPLNDWLSQTAISLKGLWETVTKQIQLLESVRRQAAVMKDIHNEFNELQILIEDIKMRIQSFTDEILTEKISTGDIANIEVGLQVEVKQIQEDVKIFVDRLAQRVPFIGRHTGPPRIDAKVLHKRFSSVDLKVGLPRQIFFELPFDLPSLDDAVRADSNSFAMRLNGQSESLTAATTHSRLARMAKEVDIVLAMTLNDINNVAREFAKFKKSYTTIMTTGDVSQPLHDLNSRLEDVLWPHQISISRSFSPIRDLLQTMDAAPGDSAVREVLYIARRRAVSDAELRFKTLAEDLASFKDQVLHAQRVEADRLEHVRVEEEHRRQAEKKRLAAEEAERLRAEKERLQHEEKLRIEEEQRAEELRVQTEKERVAAEEAEKARVERERQKAEEKQRLEDERFVAAQRLQAERARADAERAKLRQDQIEMEEKLRLMGEQLAEERRIQAEKDRVAAEIAEQQRIAAEERLAEQRRLAMEKEHPAAEDYERKRREQASSKPDRTHRHQTRKGSVSKHAKSSSSALDAEGNFVIGFNCHSYHVFTGALSRCIRFTHCSFRTVFENSRND